MGSAAGPADGNELPVLRGAEGTLRRFKPGIIMELSPYTTREAGHDFADLVRLLAGCGYSFAELESGRIWVAPGNPCSTPYEELDVPALLNG